MKDILGTKDAFPNYKDQLIKIYEKNFFLNYRFKNSDVGD